MKNRRFLSYSILIAIPVTLLLAEIVLHHRWPHWRWENAPFHSTVEALGAQVAIFMALILLQRVQGSSGKLFLLAMGFLGMGLLDGFHAAMWPGNGFVFLHSLAGLVGGLFFALAWLPDFGSRLSEKEWTPWAVAAGSMLCGLWALLLPGTLPEMVHNGEFASAAKNINILACALFLAGALRFVLDFHRSGSPEAYLFACMSLLFAVSGLTFQYSSIWNNGWWLWHLLRLIAFLLVLGFMVRQYLQVVSDLKLTIAERKQAEEALRVSEEYHRNLFENSPTALYLQDFSEVEEQVKKFKSTGITDLGVYLRENPEVAFQLSRGVVFSSVNQAAVDLYKANSQDKLLRSLDQVIIKGDSQHFIDQVVAFTNGEDSWEGEARNYNFQKEIIDIVIKKGVINRQENGTSKVLVSINDVTELHKAHENRERLEAQLQQAQKMEAISTLAGGVAHEFNNTLMGIMGNIELLKMNFSEDGGIDKQLESMESAGHRMSRLTSQLLAYAEGGKYQPKDLKLDDFVIETLPILQHDLTSNIRVETHFQKNISCINADNAQMQMVLSAILANSNEAIEDEGLIRITAENKNIDEDSTKQHPGLEAGYYVCLTIEDDGKGMDEETISGIFEPFFTTKFQGRGMGMAAVHGIVRNHDGWISVGSELGKGTTVQIYFPAIEVEVEKPIKVETEAATGSGTILMIEDEDVVIEVTQAMLEMLGYRVVVAKTGKDAIHIAETFDGQIDLALLDIKLPDIDGRNLYPLIMKARSNLKVIVWSGYSIDGPAREILDEGAQGFIQKPFSVSALSEKLKEVLEGE